jgi:hypothetical protein
MHKYSRNEMEKYHTANDKNCIVIICRTNEDIKNRLHLQHPIFERGSSPDCAAEIRKIIYMQKSAKICG